MFKKILIANRGEIACRIIRTAKKMGIQTVAVYSTADQDSLHVHQADEAFWIGESPAKDSYLNIEAIIKVAQQTKAEAIHPGYGFLSENPQFAKACNTANVVFIGPSVAAMEAMASKQLAKQLLEKTEVPLIPGYHGSDQSDKALLKEAVRMGFPVLLKAASGGGGKGMRAVYEERDFLNALTGARREALASFADNTMIIEKLVKNPRHVEIQIMADNHGQVVHLFERDCSIQRRHQKIIEEAPAPHLSENLRQKMAKAACEVAQSIDYRGAGTVEFLVDSDEQFYFMEMNTRLQVEHPVTEMITTLDLVEWQLKIAANEALPCSQKQIISQGHAIECRIYSEDPHQNFVPSIGQLHFLKEPQGEGLRIDSGITAQSQITMYYDPMMAKLICWGENREQALFRMQQALQNYAIGGVKTNLPFLQAICNHPRFIKAELSTDFLSEETLHLPEPNPQLALFMAAAYDYLALTEAKQDPLLKASFAWQMHLSSSWSWNYFIGEKEYSLRVCPLEPNEFKVHLDEQEETINVSRTTNQIRIENSRESHSALFDNQPGKIDFYYKEGTITVQRFDWQHYGAQTAAQKGQLTAPMPATVVAILKNKGDAVKIGDRLIVLEAMKMEHTIHAPKDGILAELFYDVGSQVNEGAELLALKD